MRLWNFFDRLITKIGLKELNQTPLLWSCRSFQLVSFGLWASMGTFFSAFVIFTFLDIRGYPLKENVTIYFLLGGFLMWICARMGHFISLGTKLLQNPKKYLRETVLYNQTGMLAGVILAIIAVYRLGVPLSITLDAMAIGAAVGLFFGRIGCYCYGCCWGKETDSDVGVTYTNPLSSVLRTKPHLHGKKLFPTQLMTSLTNLLIFLILILLVTLNVPNGTIFLSFLILHQGTRLWLELYRDDLQFSEGRNYTPVYAALGWIGCAGAIIFFDSTGWIQFATHATDIPIKSIVPTFIATIKNAYVWQGAVTISSAIFFLYGVHGKRLGSW